MNAMEITAAAFAKIIEASVAASILALIVLLIQFTLRARLSPAWRFALWLPVLLRLLLPYVPESPTSVFNLPQWARGQTPTSPLLAVAVNPATILPSAAPTLQASTPTAIGSTAVTPSAPVAKATLSTIEVIALLWLTGALILLSRLALGSIWFHLRLSKNRLPRKPELIELLARLRAELNLRANPDLIETPIVQSPCLFGLLKPRLLLPSNLHSQLTPAELSHVILHELAHLKRRDLFTNLLMSVAHSIHWFNPIVWLISRRMRLERELACDQIVLQSRTTTDPRAYGQTLLKLLQDFTPAPGTPALVGIAEDKHAVTLRLRQIAQFPPRSSRFSTAGLFFLLAVSAIGLTRAQGISPSKSQATPIPAAAADARSSSNSAPHLRGIEALQKEYARQKKIVEEGHAEVDKLRTELGIVGKGWLDGVPSNATAQQVAVLHQSFFEAQQKHNHDELLLNQINLLPREQLRNALPTMLQPPDELLNRYLGDLGRAEQERATLSNDHAEEHPKVKSLTALSAQINKQIEDRIDGILLGLKARRDTSQMMAQRFKEEIEMKTLDDAQKLDRYTPYFQAKRSLEQSQRLLDTIYLRLLAEKVDSQISSQN
jgi:beta-lactamase regulating signal transducer with metallopeptidase domain